MSVVVKVLSSLMMSKEGRKTLFWILVFILSPFILVAIIFIPLHEGAKTQNETNINVVFEDGAIDESYEFYDELVLIKDAFKQIDSEVVDMSEHLEGSMDILYLKATYFTLVFTDSINEKISVKSYVMDAVNHIEEITIIEDDPLTAINEYQEIVTVKIIPVSNEVFIQRVIDETKIEVQEDELNKLLLIQNVIDYVLSDEESIGSSVDDLIQELLNESYQKQEVTGAFGSPFIDGWEDKVTSEFGARSTITLPNGTITDDFHTGIDLAAPLGTDILAINDGEVVAVKYTSTGLGIYCVIDHGGGTFSIYGHTSIITVSVGQSVEKGGKIAEVGSSGYSTGPHLHLQIYKNGELVNPRNCLN